MAFPISCLSIVVALLLFPLPSGFMSCLSLVRRLPFAIVVVGFLWSHAPRVFPDTGPTRRLTEATWKSFFFSVFPGDSDGAFAPSTTAYHFDFEKLLPKAR